MDTSGQMLPVPESLPKPFAISSDLGMVLFILRSAWVMSACSPFPKGLAEAELTGCSSALLAPLHVQISKFRALCEFCFTSQRVFGVCLLDLYKVALKWMLSSSSKWLLGL